MDQKILLISNSPHQFNTLKSSLFCYGFNIQWQPSGSVTADWIHTHWSDIILINTSPHVIFAADVCRHLRQAAIYQPIVMLVSQTANEVDQILVLESGADDCVVMPISHQLLAARLRAHLRRANEFSPTHRDSLQIGDLVIDFARGQVLHNQSPLNLTPTEFRLLVCLAEHQGKVLTRSQILQIVWGYLVDVDSENVVDVHVCRLRRKVKHNPSVPSVIQTVPGIGYRLVGNNTSASSVG